MKKRLIAATIFALFGWLIGAGTGIVGLFDGIAGVWLFTSLFAVIGFFIAEDKYFTKTINLILKPLKR